MRVSWLGLCVVIAAFGAAVWVGFSLRDAVEGFRSAGEVVKLAPEGRVSHVAARAPARRNVSLSAASDAQPTGAVLGVALVASAVLLGARLLPRLRRRPDAVRRGRARIVDVGSLDPRRVEILIVDDDPDQRVALCARLKHWGYRTCAAWDGVSAVKAARKASPTLMLLDLRMPAGDGFTVLSRLHQLDLMRNVPVIVVTGADPEESRGRALDLGAALYLQKPLDPQILKAAIQSVQVRLPDPGRAAARTTLH